MTGSEPVRRDDFIGVLSVMPDVVSKLLAAHVPNGEGLCSACTRPGTGTAYVRFPCSLWSVAEAAAKRIKA